MIHPPRRLKTWPGARRRTQLVFIVRDIEPAFVASLWDMFRSEAEDR